MRWALLVVLLSGCHDWSVFDHLDLGADAQVVMDLAVTDLSAADLTPLPDLAALDLTEGADWRPLVSNTTATLRSVWGNDGKDVWVVGSGGTVLHSIDGETWSAVDAGTTADLYAVSCTVGAIWIVGDNTILRTVSGGASWSPPVANTLPSNTYYDVVAFDLTHACASGNQGIHCTTNSTDWSRPGGGAAFLTIHGLSPNDVYALGNSAAEYKNATMWNAISGAGNIEAAWESDSTDVFAVGPAGHFVKSGGMGGAWTASTVTGMPNLHGVWGGGGLDVWVVGDAGFAAHTTDANQWTQEGTGGVGVTLRGVWGTKGNGSIYAVGDGGTILKHK